MKRQFETPERIIMTKKCPDAPARKKAKVEIEIGSQAFVCPFPIRSPKISIEDATEFLRESPRVVAELTFSSISPIAGELTPCFKDGEFSDDE